MSKTKTKTKTKKSKGTQNVWGGWDAYFRSEEGIANICSVVNELSNVAARRGERWVNGKPKAVKYDQITPTSASILMAELLQIHPTLAAAIPQGVMEEHGESGIVELASLSSGESGVESADEHRVSSIRAALLIMSRGVTVCESSYTGGWDECDLQDTTVSRVPADFQPSCVDDFHAAESVVEGDDVEALCSEIDIGSDFFFNFLCDDSGAGDGSGTWTNNFSVRFMPHFHVETTELQFDEYECERCDNVQSACTCVWDDASRDYITKEEAERKDAQKEPARNDAGDEP